MLTKLFGKKEEGIVGYVYVADCDEGIFRNAAAGQIVKKQEERAALDCSRSSY